MKRTYNGLFSVLIKFAVAEIGYAFFVGLERLHTHTHARDTHVHVLAGNLICARVV